MAQLSILKFPNKKLQEKSKRVGEITKSIRDLVSDMFETMYASHGIGLAASQVGELVRVMVVDVPIVDPIDPTSHLSDPVAMINPEIISGEGTVQYEEGCLSCPDLIVKVDRLAKIKIRYLDPRGSPCEISATNLKGICIQHEMDHLDGILLVDKVSVVDQDLYRNRRIRIATDETQLANIL